MRESELGYQRRQTLFVRVARLQCTALMRLVVQFLLTTVLIAVPAVARTVVFVDNAKAGGIGTYDRPYATLGEAQAVTHDGDVIYVAQGNAPYEGAITLKRGQMLIGAAFGLDAAAAEFHTQFDSPPVPAVQGPGPTIHGGVWLNGENVVAGCTIVVENGTGIGCSTPDATISLRKVFVRPARFAAGIALQSPGAVSIIDGGVEGATSGAALTISGGNADITIERFPISGSYGTVLSIGGRDRGRVLFRNGSRLKIADASQDAIVLINCAAPVVFSDPLQVVTHGGRGLFARNSKLTISGGNSSIESNNAPAVEMHDVAADIALESVSAAGVAPGKLSDGVVLEKIHGKFVVAGRDEKAGSGGTIRNAQSYGVRIAQSSGIRMAHMAIVDSGTSDAICVDATERETNVRCRAAVYLRHLSASAFEDLAITGGAGVGVNANNISDVTFAGLQITGAGRTLQEPGLLLQEASGTIAFTECRILDGAGGAAIFEQRFNSARIAFSRCDLGAPQRWASAPWLVRGRTSGSARLEIELVNSQLHENSGGALSIESNDLSHSSLIVNDTTVQRIGGRAIDLVARNSAHARLSAHRSLLYAAGAADKIGVSVLAGKDASDTAGICAELADNQIVTGGAEPPIRVAAGSARSTVQVVGPSRADPSAVAAYIAQTNNGARVSIESHLPISINPACE